LKILIEEAEIQAAVTRIAAEIREKEGGKPLTVVAIMTGSIVFLADLIRKLDIPLRVGVIATSSYRDGENRGKLVINSEMLVDIADRDVLLVDDIFDTGHTLFEVIALLDEFNPRSIKSAVLLHKEGKQQVEMEPDFVGFKIPDKFVVGYGLDYNDAFRNLPFIGVPDPEDLAAHK
jgi:hypoxanthine phosphoribosyltransferase